MQKYSQYWTPGRARQKRAWLKRSSSLPEAQPSVLHIPSKTTIPMPSSEEVACRQVSSNTIGRAEYKKGQIKTKRGTYNLLLGVLNCTKEFSIDCIESTSQPEDSHQISGFQRNLLQMLPEYCLSLQQSYSLCV